MKIQELCNRLFVDKIRKPARLPGHNPQTVRCHLNQFKCLLLLSRLFHMSSHSLHHLCSQMQRASRWQGHRTGGIQTHEPFGGDVPGATNSGLGVCDRSIFVGLSHCYAEVAYLRGQCVNCSNKTGIKLDSLHLKNQIKLSRRGWWGWDLILFLQKQ